ncbi:MAG TPA: S1 RNA-binding domain-containing protein [Candidatus Saccharimonadia bacterium]|nr:S1 RNA-binding domain-containing protein [Candidatus Saccharimonadia bacterium]
MDKEISVGSTIEGTISYINIFAAFVEIVDCDYHVLLLNCEAVTRDGQLPIRMNNTVDLGETRQFRVIKVDDERKRIHLSMNGIIKIDEVEKPQ